MMLGLRKQKQKRREVELEQRKHVQDRAALEERREAAVELEKSAHAAATGYGSNVGVALLVPVKKWVCFSMLFLGMLTENQPQITRLQ